jgi:hypothetical protein
LTIPLLLWYNKRKTRRYKMKRIEYNTESTNYLKAKKMANNLMLESPLVKEVSIDCNRDSGYWIIRVALYPKDFIEKYSK